MAGNYSRNRSGTTGRRMRLLLRKRVNSLFGDERKSEHVGNSKYRPQWVGSIEGYTVNKLQANLWRFDSIMGYEDAYQEAFIKFLELSSRYEDKVDNPRWFMALYKRSLYNLVTDFANQARRLRRQVCFVELESDDAEDSYVERLRGDDSAAELEILLENAPEHVRQVLTLLSADNSAMLGVLAQSWERQGKRKLDGNEFLCRMLGYDHRKVDLVWATKAYLEEEHDGDD